MIQTLHSPPTGMPTTMLSPVAYSGRSGNSGDKLGWRSGTERMVLASGGRTASSRPGDETNSAALDPPPAVTVVHFRTEDGLYRSRCRIRRQALTKIPRAAPHCRIQVMPPRSNRPSSAYRGDGAARSTLAAAERELYGTRHSVRIVRLEARTSSPSCGREGRKTQ